MPTATPRVRGRKGVERRAAYLRAHPLCVVCMAKGVVRAATQVDHKHALIHGGPDTDENKQALCSACHRLKTDTDIGRTSRGCDEDGNPLDARHHWHNKRGKGKG